MKIAKKVLSVFLAVVIALGAFAVAASANGNPDTAEYQAKIWLTGTTGSAVWSSNTKVTMTENTDEVVGAYYNDLLAAKEGAGVITAQPGETVFVRLYCSNNYYVHTFQTNVFFSSGLIDAAENYATQRSGKELSQSNLKKIHIWNKDHYWVGIQGDAYAGYNAWTLQDDTVNVDVAANWPTDDEGNNLFNIEDWKWNRFYNLTYEAAGETCIWDDDMETPASETHLFMMPVFIPEDAAPGSEYYVTIPEGLEQRTVKKYGSTRLSEVGIAEGEDAPCDVVDAYAALYKNMEYADDNQYFDYSQSTLKIVIPGEAVEEINYDALQAKYDEVKDTDLTGKVTADAVAAFEAVLGQAATMLTNKDAADQAAVDNMTTLLTNAYAALKDIASYTDLDAAIADFEALTESDWTADSYAAAKTAYEAAKAVARDLSTDEQATVDTAATALANAIGALKKNIDYSALQAKYDALKDKDLAPYTDDTAAAFSTALANAAAMLDAKNAEDQAAVAALVTALENAEAGLVEKDADYTALDAAIAAYEGKTASDWTTATWEAATEAYNDAKAVARDLKYSAQATVDTAATALENALDALAPAGAANYAALDAAIADFEAKVEAHYTADTYATAKTAYEAAKAVARDLTGNDQTIIDTATTALTVAIHNLVEAEADYTAVNTAITAADAKIAEKDEGILRYSDAYIAEVEAAKAAVVEGLKAKDQTTVDGYAAAINALLAAPVYRDYDYSVVNATYAEWQAKNEKDYTAASWAAVQAKYDAIVWDLTHADYAKAKLQQIQFVNAYNALAEAGEGDYTAVNDAIAAYEEKVAAAEYTADSIAAVEAAIDAVNWDLNKNYADEIAAYAAAIEEATANLVPVVYANYAYLDAAIADAATYAADDYTAASYKALTDAVEAGKAIDRKLLDADQSIVDAATTAITDAIVALAKKANYATLNNAIEAAAGYNKNAYTTASWANLEAAVEAGKAVDADLSEADQAIIDNAAAAIMDAIAKLEEKAVKSSVTNVTYDKSLDTHNTFTVTVDGRPAMIQFIEMDGGTRTYDRYNKNVTIVSYDAEGNEVSNLSRDLAYEVWTINTNLIGPDVKVRAKYLTGTSYVWDKETFDFTVELLQPVYDADVRSITPAATEGAKGAVTTVVVVGPDAQALRFVMPNGTTTTYAVSKAAVLENGDLEFTGKAWMNAEGVNTITVQTKIAGVWTTVGTFDYTVA